MNRQKRLKRLARKQTAPVEIRVTFRDMRNPAWDQPTSLDPPRATPKEITPLGDPQKTLAREHPQVCPSCGRGGV